MTFQEPIATAWTCSMISPAFATRRPLVGLPGRHLAVPAIMAALRPAIDRLAERAGERLVLFLPLLILPTVGALPDLVLLASLFAVVSMVEAGLHPAPGRSGLVLGAVGCLAVGFGFSAGAASALALFALVRTVERRVPEALWPIGVLLAALATTLLVDLALVGLGLERGGVWLALAAAIGAAAAARRLAGARAEPATPALQAIAGQAPSRALPETVLVGAMALVLALYAALLAQEPALLQLGHEHRFLALPLLALALARLVWLALGPGRLAPADPSAILLLASWALASLVLGGA